MYPIGYTWKFFFPSFLHTVCRRITELLFSSSIFIIIQFNYHHWSQYKFNLNLTLIYHHKLSKLKYPKMNEPNNADNETIEYHTHHTGTELDDDGYYCTEST